VLDLAERLHPMNALGLLGPKSIRIGERSLIHLPVLGFVDESAFGPIGRHFINLVGHFALLRSPAGLYGRSLLQVFVDGRFSAALCDGPTRTDKAISVLLRRPAARPNRHAATTPRSCQSLRRSPGTRSTSCRDRSPGAACRGPRSCN